MRRDHLTKMSLAIAAGLLVAACGGDDEPAAEPPADEVTDEMTDAAGDDTADDAGGEAAEDAGDGDGDAGGAGTNDEAQESLDDAGVDLDLDELEETVGNFSTGEGGGTVTIDGVAYTFESTAVCIVQGDDFVAEGLGQDPDGNPAWVSINASRDDFDGDGEAGPYIDVYVEPGRVELFGEGPDDAPDFAASYFDGFGEEITYELNDGRITGSGPISDFNGVAIPFGETGEMTFEAFCG